MMKRFCGEKFCVMNVLEEGGLYLTVWNLLGLLELLEA